jgi:GNAT superfamily N-acetyltransferase
LIKPADHHLISSLTLLFEQEGQISLAQWLQHCVEEEAMTFIACESSEPVGFISLLTEASYPAFHKEGIPEIHGMAVLPSCRGQGVGKRMLEKIEHHAREQGFQKIGLGVGVTEDYQDAFRLYVGKGYKPDGRGLYHGSLPHEFARYGDQITVDNSTTLWLMKTLN